jgi:hypothetical protein
MQNSRSVSYIKQSLTREVTPAVSISGRALASSCPKIRQKKQYQIMVCYRKPSLPKEYRTRSQGKTLPPEDRQQRLSLRLFVVQL